MNVYFSDVFGIAYQRLDDYGAFDISLTNDLPLFIDPFLLFHSRKPKYQELHTEIIDYVKFLRDMTLDGEINPGLIKEWFYFREVKQTWLGFSVSSNKGRGLAQTFADSLVWGLRNVFRDFGERKVSNGSHLEKLGLLDEGIGRDMISDFTTTLIKRFLCEYTQTFAQREIPQQFRKVVQVGKAMFNYETRAWETRSYELPFYRRDFVLLTPRDILTRDQTWINRPDLMNRFETLVDAVPNDQLRGQINQYLIRAIGKKVKDSERRKVYRDAIHEFPTILDYYIRDKEANGDKATATSIEKVKETYGFFVDQLREFVTTLLEPAGFYDVNGAPLERCGRRIEILKDMLEQRSARKFFCREGKPVATQDELQLLLRMLWLASPGRPREDDLDAEDTASLKLIEMKLGSNAQLARSVETFSQNEEGTRRFVIVSFTDADLSRVEAARKDPAIRARKDIVHFDAREDRRARPMKDFFVSYNTNDRQWAEWIAWTLEAEGYTTVIQAWDFRAGGDFVMEMQKAATGTRKTIAVLSENYLHAEYTQPEWGNAFSRDPQGRDRTLIPVRVEKCKPDGLLAPRIYVDLVGLAEADARDKLLDELKDRGKPATSPAFPGSAHAQSATPVTVHAPSSFPGRASSAVEVWQEKLEFLRVQEPLAAAADQKFALKKQIEEAMEKIRELRGNP